MKAMKVLLLAVLAVGLVGAVVLASSSNTWTSSFTIADCVTVTFGGDLYIQDMANVQICTSTGWFPTNMATGTVTANCDFHVYYDVKPFTHNADATCELPTDVQATFDGTPTGWVPVPVGGFSGDFWAYVGCVGGAPNHFLPGTQLLGSGQLRVNRSGMSDRAGTYTARVAVTVAW